MTTNSNIAICIDNLSFEYSQKSNFRLNKISLNFEFGKTYAILGQNGSGKSTLLKCMNSQITKYNGNIFINAEGKMQNLSSLNITDRAKNISFVSQHAMNTELEVFDAVMLGRKPYINISANASDYEYATKSINLLNINHICMKKCSELSGGELQSVAIAQAFAQNTPIMMLDEPTNNLDIKKQHELFEIIKTQVKSKNLCAICILHDINYAMQYADKFIFMKDGSLVTCGDKDIVTESLINKTYGIQSRIIKDGENQYIII